MKQQNEFKKGDKFKNKILKRRKFSPVPLSFAQQRLFVLNRLVPSNPFYNISAPFVLLKKLDINVFKNSLNEMIRRHEILRTVFTIENGTPVQKILSNLDFSLDFVDLKRLSRKKQKEELQRLCITQSSKPIDIETAPLFRCGLYHLRENEFLIFLTIHHIIYDIWSSEIFQKEMMDIYSAFSLGQSSPLPQLPIQYADFSVWQREFLQGNVLEKQLTFWKTQLGGELPVLELPLDYPRPAVQSYKGSVKIFRLSESLTRGLIEISRRERCSLFMTTLTALNILFHRYTNQDDILIGTTVANRNRVELESLIGFFTNTLVFRTDLSGNPSFLKLLKRVQNTATAAYDNQDLPFEKLVEELLPERYMSHSPIFQVLLTVIQDNLYQKVEAPVANSTAKMVDDINFHQKTSIFDLLFFISIEANKFNGLIEYNTEIFNECTIDRLINNFQSLLIEIVENPYQPVNDMNILSGEDKERLLVHWNKTKKEYEMQCLHHLFEVQTKKSPGKSAIIFKNENLTYKELNDRSNGLKRILNSRGIIPNEPVGICMERSLEMVIGLLGILKSGGAYMPLDPDLPKDRLSYMMKDANISTLLTQETFADKWADFPIATINIDNMRGRMIKEDDCREEVKVSSQDFTSIGSVSYSPSSSWVAGAARSVKNTAYVIYTSGSTGRPKGVMISHEGICNRLQWMQDQYKLTPWDRILQKTPFGFDVSVWEFFWPLLFGAQLVIANPGGHKDTTYLIKNIIKNGITIMHFVPSMLNAFLEDPMVKQIKSLRMVVSSGEPLAFEYQQRFFSLLDAELHNLYGPTEASVDVTFWKCKRDDEGSKVPIGHPISNTQIFILDKKLDLVPVGVPGELHIGGVNLAKGYINQPELTIKRFIEDPFSNTHNGRLYKTGDLVRYLDDGAIEYIGRLDSQVKLRGFRIELSEIESNIRSYPGIQDAVTLITEREAPATPKRNNTGQKGDGCHKRLVSYIVPDQGYWNLDNKDSNSNITAEQVSDWQDVFNDTYIKEHSTKDPKFNISGWNNSYTGLPIPWEEMRQWVDDTVRRIRSLKPNRVLEIGCGTGLLLFEIIPFCEYYMGTDISEKGLEYIRQNFKEYNEKVDLLCCEAHQFEHIVKGDFDIVIINSVVQYFPSLNYLLRVIEGAIEAVKPDGVIFIGDVRNLSLLKEFRSSVEFYKADVSSTREKLYRKVMRSISREQELVIDPDFFIALKEKFPVITFVERFLKSSPYNNELTKFRYDVLLHIDSQPSTLFDVQSVNWQEKNLKKEDIVTLLEKERPQLLRINRIVNPRISTDIQIFSWLNSSDHPIETIEEFQKKIEILPKVGINPNDLLDIGNKCPYHVELVHSDSHFKECYDVIFKHWDLSGLSLGNEWVSHKENEVKHQPLHNYANNPLLLKITNELIPGLRNDLKERLPGYMVPANFILIEELPMTQNGKLDRDALPKSFLLDEPEEDMIEPKTTNERLIEKVWGDVLGVDQISINKNFFELGGDSIIAIRVISRINQAGFNLNLQDLYNNQNIADLAQAAEKNQASVEENISPDDLIQDVDMKKILTYLPPGSEIEDIYPAIPIQKHMIHYLQNHEVVDPPLFQFHGRMSFPDLEISILRKALQMVSDITPQLRTVILWKDLPEPIQVVLKKVKYDLKYFDLSYLEPEAQEEKIKMIMKEEWELKFDNHISIPLRFIIVKKGEGNFEEIYTADYFRLAAWSFSQIYENTVKVYSGLLRNEKISILTNQYYKKYLDQIKNQVFEEARKYWQSVFNGYKSSKSFLEKFPDSVRGKENGIGGYFFNLSFEMSSQLDVFLQSNRLILSTFIQGIWAMLISCYTFEERVLFGFITGARANVFAGIEEMMGYTINLLPVIVKMSPGELLINWLKELWENHVIWGGFEYSQIEDVFNWCGLPDEQPFFETIVVVQNVSYTKDNQRVRRVSDKIKLSGRSDSIRKMECPLRLDVYPGDNIRLDFNYYRKFLTESSIITIGENLIALIEAIIANPKQTVGELMNLIKTGEKQLMMV